jgi:CBS domain containing-hemolysin-like protein
VLLILGALGVMSFFFSMSETSIVSLSKIRLKHMLSRGLKHSQSIQRLMSHSEKFITTILVGNNFVNISFSVIVSAIFVHIFGEKMGILLATLFTTGFILTFCEICPKILALKNTDRMALFAAPIMEAVVKLLSPITRIFVSFGDLVLKILRIEQVKKAHLITEEELKMMIEVGKEEGVLTDEERKMLHRIFEFGDIEVGDVMIPKEKIVGVSIRASQEDLLNIFAEQGHSRLPVYKESMDFIIGVVYARDLLYLMRDKGLFLLADLMHNGYYVPRKMKVNDLLRKFQADKLQMAIVVDEHKKTLGIITLEDLIEEIVGEIEENVHNHGASK